MSMSKMFKICISSMMLYINSLLIWDPSFYLCHIYRVDLYFVVMFGSPVLDYHYCTFWSVYNIMELLVRFSGCRVGKF